MPKILKTPAPTSAQKVAAAQPGKKTTEVMRNPNSTHNDLVNAVNTDAVVAKRKPREVIYPAVECEVCDGDNAITEDMAKTILGWEYESDYANRARLEFPDTKPEHWVFGEQYLLVDEEGMKVECQHNLDNRPFDRQWSRGLAEVILTGNWSGPTTFRGETVNGSTIVLSKTGRVESGQHSLIGLILACQLYRKNPDAYPFWKNLGREPVIETIIIKGISEDARVTMTVDNCRARTMTDIFYTSELFKSLPTVDRKECSKMMANASDHAWTRTAAQGYRTAPEMKGFVERHPHLLKAVEHLFGENKKDAGKKTRPISALRITPGLAASLCFLMGASGPATDGDVYRNGFPPSEKDVDWSRWPKAKEFWAMLGGHKEFAPVRQALASLYESSADNEDGNIGMGGRIPERLALIMRAWDVFCAYDPTVGVPMFDAADLSEGGALYLAYTNVSDPDKNGNTVVLPDGQLKLLDRADFKGIDVPEKVKGAVVGISEPPPMTSAELQAEKDKIERERAMQRAAMPNAKATALAKLKSLRKS